MKRKLFVLALCLTGGCLTAANPYAAMNDDPPPRVEKIAGGQIPLVRNGTAEMEIVIPSDAFPIVRFAAEEISGKLKEASGAEIQIRNTPSNTGKTVLFLGDQEAVRNAGIKVDQIPRDGFILKTSGKNIYLAGNDSPKLAPDTRGWGIIQERGTLHGSYSFLERFAGVRYYFPGKVGTVVPKNKNLSMPEMELMDRPDFPRRRIGTFGTIWFPEQSPAARAQYMFQLRTETFYVPCCHGLERMKYQLRIAKTHPEYIAMNSEGKRYLDPASPYFGNICYSSQGMRSEIYKDAEAFLTGKPASSRGLQNWDPSSNQPGFFDLMPKDHFKDCLCPECKKFYAAHKYKSDLVWDLLNDIAGQLKKNGIPGMLTMLAYGHYTEVPDVKFHDNILMQVAVNGPWAEITPALQKKHDLRILDWKKKMGRKPWLWTYIGKYGALELPGAPPSTPRAVGNYFKRQAKHICGGFIESESDSQLTQYLNHYVFSRVAWDTRTDVDSLLREHHQLMFGKGAEPMGKFFDVLEDLWMQKIAGRIVETPIGPQAIPPGDYDLWENIYSPKLLAQMQSWFKDAGKRAADDPEAIRRIHYFERYFLGPLQTESKHYFELKQAASSANYRTRTLDHAPTEADWNAAPRAWLLPMKSDKAEVATVFQALADKDNLYFKVYCEEPYMPRIVANSLMKDDPALWTDSVVEFFINPDGRRRDYFHFILNSRETRYDAKCRREGAGSTSDPKWDSAAKQKVVREKECWTVFLIVPKKELPGFDQEKCAINIARHRAVTGKKTAVALYSSSPYVKNFHDLEHFPNFDFSGRKNADPVIDNGDMALPFVGRSFGKWSAGQKDVDEKRVVMDKEIYRSAGQSLRIASPDGGILHGGTQYLSLKPETRYRLSFFVKTQDVKPDGKGYQGHGGAAVNIATPVNRWFPANNYQGTMPWTRQSFEFKTGTPKKGQLYYIRLSMMNATGIVWFDSVSIEEII